MVTTPVTCPTEEADLSITKATSQQSVQPGGTLSYTVTVTNNGPDTATSIVITDDIPSPLTFNATGSDPLCHMSGTTQVVCDNFSLADDQSRSFTIAFTVPASATCNASVQNTARVSSSASDPVGSNNTVQTTPIPIRCITPTFTITKTDNRTTALPGETLTYQITVTNTSTATATTVVITDVLPSVLTDITASDNGTRNGSTVTWTLSSLAAGASRTLLVVAVIPASTMNGTVLTNIAIVGSVTAQDQTTVGSNGVCDLGITLTDSRDPVEVDDTFTYTVQVRNNSSQTTSNVMLTLSLDSDVEFVSASNGGYNDSNSAVRWNNLSLPSGTSTFTATVRVKDDREGALIHSTAFACNGQDYEDTRVEGEPIPPPPPPPPFVNGRVTIDKRADRSEAHPGSIVSYTITIRNGSNVPTGPIMIEDTFSPRDMTVEDAAGGMTNGSGIEWDLGTIGGYVTRIITYRVRFSSALSQGQTVSNTVRILNSQAGDTENVRVIRQYPQTGLLSSFTSNSMDKEQFLRPVSPKRRDDMDAASLPTVIWITIMAAGTAAGGLIGKKLFLVPI
jgi:uncharacterized repeat protein (TIGR01451 family)